jgi:hypothetical protein
MIGFMPLNRIVFILLLPFALASCMDTREELEIKKDGSGTLVMKTDMGQLVKMMKGFVNDSDLQKQGLGRVIDTTMLVKTFVDSARDVPEDKKAVLRDGKLHLNLDVQNDLGKFDMAFPFSSTDHLSKLYESLNTSSGGLKSLMGNIGGNQEGQGPGDDKGLPQITAVYDITVKKGLYSRKVNKARYETFSQTIKLDQLKQMSSMLGAMNYTLVVTLPQPIKKASNAKAVLSADKKTVTLSTDLMETFEHPELLELELEY